MMAPSPKHEFHLRDFSTPPAGGPTSEPSASRTEESKLEAFENGYKSGWEDAKNALDAEKLSFCSTVEDAIRNSRKSHEDAFRDLVLEIEPLLCGLASKSLPKIVGSHFGESVLELIHENLASPSDMPLELKANDATNAKIAALLSDDIADQVALVADNGLADGQVIATQNGTAKLTDVARVLSEIETRIESFFEANRKE